MRGISLMERSIETYERLRMVENEINDKQMDLAEYEYNFNILKQGIYSMDRYMSMKEKVDSMKNEIEQLEEEQESISNEFVLVRDSLHEFVVNKRVVHFKQDDVFVNYCSVKEFEPDE